MSLYDNIIIDNLGLSDTYYRLNASSPDKKINSYNNFNSDRAEIYQSDTIEISYKGRGFVKAKDIVDNQNDTIREELVKTIKERIDKQIYFTEETAQLIAEKIVNGWRGRN